MAQVMEFKFSASEEYQLQAIEAAAGLLEGQPFIRSQLVVPKEATFQAIANRLDLDEAMILTNLQKVQSGQDIAVDAALQLIEAEIETVAGRQAARFPNFSVEMETGTGKTYVYV